MRTAFCDTLLRLAAADPSLMLLTGDLGFGDFDRFRAEFPDRFLNVGVAEQNLASVAAGLAKEGHMVFAYSIGPFPSLRCLEQFRNGACYHDLPVVMVSSGAGFAYGALGYTHYAMEELGVMRALPRVAIGTPANRSEAAMLTDWFAKRRKPGYLRLDRGAAAPTNAPAPITQVGKATLLSDGHHITLASYGSLVIEAQAAAAALAQSGIFCRVLAFNTLTPLDTDALSAAAQETGGLVVAEEHSIHGGLADAASSALLEIGYPPRVFARLGVREPPAAHTGSQAWTRALHGIDAQAIESKVRQLLEGKPA